MRPWVSLYNSICLCYSSSVVLTLPPHVCVRILDICDSERRSCPMTPRQRQQMGGYSSSRCKVSLGFLCVSLAKHGVCEQHLKRMEAKCVDRFLDAASILGCGFGARLSIPLGVCRQCSWQAHPAESQGVLWKGQRTLWSWGFQWGIPTWSIKGCLCVWRPVHLNVFTAPLLTPSQHSGSFQQPGLKIMFCLCHDEGCVDEMVSLPPSPSL